MHTRLQNMHTELARAHDHTLHFTPQPPLPLPHSPAKTSTAREACLETGGRDWGREGRGVEGRWGTSASLRLAQLPSNRVRPTSQSAAL